MRARVGLIVALAFVAVAYAAPPASAAVTCTFDDPSDTLAVNMTATGELAVLRVELDGTIIVTAGTVLTCAGGTPTVTTVDTINVFDNSADGSTRTFIREPQRFAPGVTIEQANPLFSEIEINVAPGGGTNDNIFVTGTTGQDVWALGAAGLNANVGVGTNDVEIDAIGDPDLFALSGGDAGDELDAQGGSGTGAAFSTPGLEIDGGEGSDSIQGGEAPSGDFLFGDEGDDTVRGLTGDDTLSGVPGTDTLDGGTGVDQARWGGGNSVTVDLALTGFQETGDGRVRLVGIENLAGSDSSDTLFGDANANAIDGRDGIDVLEGRAGNDALNDTADGAVASYAQAPAAVDANLTTGTATGGAGSDSLSGIGELVGSPFDDTLTGNAFANSITGGAGRDAISALAGADDVQVRDGEADAASCGTELDTATADRASLDAVDADCETTSFLPEPDGGGDDGGGGEAPDTEVQFVLSGKVKQRVLRREAIVATASCPLEDCTVRVSGAVKPRTVEVAAAVPERLALDLKRKTLRKVERALDDGRKPGLAVRAQVADAAGNTATDKLRVKAKP